MHKRTAIGIHPLIAFVVFVLLIYVMSDKLIAALVVGAVVTIAAWALSEFA